MRTSYTPRSSRIPVDTAQQFVLAPLSQSAATDPALTVALAWFHAASTTQQSAWEDACNKALSKAKEQAPRLTVPSCSSGPVTTMMSAMLQLGQSGAMDGLLLRRRFPDTSVVILTMHENQQYLKQIVTAGATACVLKRSAGTELVTAVKAAARGESHFSPIMARMLLDVYRLRLVEEGSDELSQLTELEREVLQLVAEGKSS